MTIIASCFVPVPAISEANRKGHEHWRKSKERHDAQKEHTIYTLSAMRISDHAVLRNIPLEEPLLVRLISVSVNPPDDDNLASSVKYFRDAVAFWLGVPDEDPRVKYIPKWERYRGKGERGVRIEFVRFIDHLREEQERIAAQIATLTGEK